MHNNAHPDATLKRHNNCIYYNETLQLYVASNFNLLLLQVWQYTNCLIIDL